jgi:hypothetical protein
MYPDYRRGSKHLNLIRKMLFRRRTWDDLRSFWVCAVLYNKDVHVLASVARRTLTQNLVHCYWNLPKQQSACRLPAPSGSRAEAWETAVVEAGTSRRAGVLNK